MKGWTAISSISRALLDKWEDLFTPPFMNRKRRYRQYSVGEWTYGSPRVLHWGKGALTIGKYCSFASGVTILLDGEHHTDWISTYPFDVLMQQGGEAFRSEKAKGAVEIGHDVWIGTDAMILSGVKIGSGAVLGARSVVTKDVPPYAIVAGNPARVLRYRFSPEVVEALLQSTWWDWPQPEVARVKDLLMSSSVDSFLAMVATMSRPSEAR